MDLLAKLREALGLKDDADETTAIAAAIDGLKTTASAHAAIARAAGLDDKAEATAIQAAVTTLKTAADAGETALQTALKPIAVAAGLKDDAKPEAILAAVTTLAGAKATARRSRAAGGADRGRRPAEDAAGRHGAGQGDRGRRRGDQGRQARRQAVMRDHYIARHMADPAAVEKEFAAHAVARRPPRRCRPRRREGQGRQDRAQRRAAHRRPRRSASSPEATARRRSRRKPPRPSGLTARRPFPDPDSHTGDT